MAENRVEQFLSIRRGPDGVEGTEDDVKFTGPQDLQVALGFSPEQFNQLAGLITYQDSVLRIVSVGKSGTVSRTVRMVINKQNNSIRLITWKEL
jgi:hypothetical protein